MIHKIRHTTNKRCVVCGARELEPCVDPRQGQDQVAFLEAELLRVLHELRDADPDNYLVRVVTMSMKAVDEYNSGQQSLRLR